MDLLRSAAVPDPNLAGVSLDDGTGAVEGGIDAADPYVREAQTFPQLTEEMVARIATHGTEERLGKGTMLFREGDRGIDFFVVLDGAIEIHRFLQPA